MANPLFDSIKQEHPTWTDEQVWTAVSLKMQSDVVIDNAGSDVDPNDPDIISQIIKGAEVWLEEALPLIFEKVEQLFRQLLDNLAEWIKKGFEYVIRLIGEYIPQIF